MDYKGVIKDFQRIRENKTPGRVPFHANSEKFDVKWQDINPQTNNYT